MAAPQRIGDYEIEGEIGAGGMARVFRARHPLLDTRHAIKVLDPAWRENESARKRFLDEARIQAKHLDHPNIVKVTGIVATAEHAALVMELVEGGSLEARIPAIREKPAEIRRVMYGVLDAVGKAHDAGIIHRDLKPANVLLAADGTPKVTDFGIAKVITSDDATKKATAADARMGTLVYMSPEQIRRAKDVTARSDIFALGAMLYEMATGTLAFPGESDYDVMDAIINGRYTPPRTAYPACDPVLASVIARALESDPANRFASCAEMAAALRAETPRDTGPKLHASPPAKPAVPEGEPRRRQWPVLLLALGGIGLLGGALLVRGMGSSSAPIDAPVAARDASPAVALGTVDAVEIDAAPPVVLASIDAAARPPGDPDAIVYCASGFVAGQESECGAEAPRHAAWHLHGYLVGDGSCYECWDELDDDCESEAPKRTGFRFASRTSCGSTPPAQPGNARRYSSRSMTTTATSSAKPKLDAPKPAPPPLPPPPPAADRIAYCVSGFVDGTPSICARDRVRHKLWHLHGYVSSLAGNCLECWDEEDSDCETFVPQEHSFPYLGGSCGGRTPAPEDEFIRRVP